MLAFILRRAGQGLLVIFAMVVIVFFGVNVIGDPVWILVSPDMDQGQIEEVSRSLGLDKPIYEQFFYFFKISLGSPACENCQFLTTEVEVGIKTIPFIETPESLFKLHTVLPESHLVAIVKLACC